MLYKSAVNTDYLLVARLWLFVLLHHLACGIFEVHLEVQGWGYKWNIPLPVTYYIWHMMLYILLKASEIVEIPFLSITLFINIHTWFITFCLWLTKRIMNLISLGGGELEKSMLKRTKDQNQSWILVTFDPWRDLSFHKARRVTKQKRAVIQ